MRIVRFAADLPLAEAVGITVKPNLHVRRLLSVRKEYYVLWSCYYFWFRIQKLRKHQMMGIQVTGLSNGEDPSRCLRTLFWANFSENLHENEQHRTKGGTNPISVADPGFSRWGGGCQLLSLGQKGII